VHSYVSTLTVFSRCYCKYASCLAKSTAGKLLHCYHVMFAMDQLWPLVLCREPAKFVAKLREHKTDKRMLLFKCDLGAGHFSQSGRFDRLKDMAMEYAFLIKCQDLIDKTCSQE